MNANLRVRSKIQNMSEELDVATRYIYESYDSPNVCTKGKNRKNTV